MPLPSTLTPIATVTLTSSASTVAFTSIPSTYTDLMLVLTGKYTGVDDSSPALRFNGDSSSNYSTTYLNGSAGSATSAREANGNTIYIGSMSGDQSTSIAHILNYSNATTYKTVLSRGGHTTYRVRAYVGVWRATPQTITRIDAYGNGTYNFDVGTTLTLYGIKAA